MVRTPTTHTLANVKQRLRNAADNCIVSYRCTDGRRLTLLGHGVDLPTRVAAADAQLPSGEWLRECVSTPASIYSDLCGHELAANRQEELRGIIYIGYERRTVVVP